MLISIEQFYIISVQYLSLQLLILYLTLFLIKIIKLSSSNLNYNFFLTSNKNIFKLIRAVEIKRFNSCLYFYYINNRINPLIIMVDLSKIPPIIKKRQSYIELLKKL